MQADQTGHDDCHVDLAGDGFDRNDRTGVGVLRNDVTESDRGERDDRKVVRHSVVRGEFSQRGLIPAQPRVDEKGVGMENHDKGIDRREDGRKNQIPADAADECVRGDNGGSENILEDDREHAQKKQERHEFSDQSGQRRIDEWIDESGRDREKSDSGEHQNVNSLRDRGKDPRNHDRAIDQIRDPDSNSIILKQRSEEDRAEQGDEKPPVMPQTGDSSHSESDR